MVGGVVRESWVSCKGGAGFPQQGNNYTLGRKRLKSDLRQLDPSMPGSEELDFCIVNVSSWLIQNHSAHKREAGGEGSVVGAVLVPATRKALTLAALGFEQRSASLLGESWFSISLSVFFPQRWSLPKGFRRWRTPASKPSPMR